MGDLARFSVWAEEAHDNGTTAVVLISGEVDRSNGDELQDLMVGPALSAYHEMVVDLSGVTFMGSTGLNVLISTKRLLDQEGRSFRLRRPSSAVRRTLEVSGLLETFEVEV
jgi:anti-sigma B factor antagonist